MKLVSTATTLDQFRNDVIQYIELRAEQNRAAEKCFSGKAARRMYAHAALQLQSVADDIRDLKAEALC
jgi:hypothetical protein